MPAANIKLVSGAPTHVRHACELHVLVVGEGCVGSADGHGEQEHIFRMRLAGQGGEQILRFLRRNRWVKGDALQKRSCVVGSTLTSAPGLSCSASSS